MMRYALVWLAGMATVIVALAFRALVEEHEVRYEVHYQLHQEIMRYEPEAHGPRHEQDSYTEGQQAGGRLIVLCGSVDQVRPTSVAFLTPRIEAPIRIAPPVGGLRFTKPGKQIGSTECGAHYQAVRMREIRQGFSVQTWVELAPVGHDGGASKPIGWSYWGEQTAKESTNFRRFQPLASTARP